MSSSSSRSSSCSSSRSSSWQIAHYGAQWEQHLTQAPLLLEVADEFVASVFRHQLKQQVGESDILFGPEVTVEALEEKLLGLNLFFQGRFCLVFDAHKMPQPAVSFLAETEAPWQQLKAVFVSTKKHPALARLFAEKGAHHRLELPKFWQMEQLLDFFCQHFALTLERRGKSLFMDLVEPTSRHYFESCQLLQNHYPNGEALGARELGRTLVRSRLDRFALARQLAERKGRAFYQALLHEEHSWEDWRQAFLFLQSHVVKLMDPSYASQKQGRLSQYDQQLVAQSKHWREGPLRELLQQLAQWELACKRRESGLKNQLRLKSLQA